ncbi:MAG: peroxidase family protein [Actinoplanes sp.]
MWTYDDHEHFERDEHRLFARLAHDLMLVQLKNRPRGATKVRRALHADAVLSVGNAVLTVHEDLPEALCQGPFQPGRQWPVTVRFSNASPVHQPDHAKDLRGVALRIEAYGEDGEGSVHDLLMTNWPVSPAANAREFVAIAKAVAGRRSTPARLLSLALRLPPEVGPRATVRILSNLIESARPSQSLALATYFSRGAIRWGTAGPVRYRLQPAARPVRPPAQGTRLRPDLARRLAADDLVFELAVQRFVDEERTSVEDTSRDWSIEDAPVVPVATLRIPSQDAGSLEFQRAERRIEQMAFNPWHTTADFRPLGNLNRARKAAYEASSAHRLGLRYATPESLGERARNVVAAVVFQTLNRAGLPWHRMPGRLAVLNLTLLRRRLRRDNLIDTDPVETPPLTRSPAAPPPEETRTTRTYDGTYNDLSAPHMGAVGAGFGRNLPADDNPRHTPDPIVVSDLLLRRESFIPAPSLNLLAAAWIQFQVHDWVKHERLPLDQSSIDLPLPDGRTWRNTVGGEPEPVMRIAANTGGGNRVSHWWDGSEVYGVDEPMARSLREPGGGARLALDGNFLPPGERGLPLSGFTDSWWLGLSALHTLFAREHNAVCDALRREYPAMDEEQVYQTARLIVSALIAKIHTIEWTPAILATETIDTALNINWSGVAPSQWLTRLGLRLFDANAVHGILRTLPDHHGVPFSLTEDFVTVYRMHPLIPDDYVFMDHRTGEQLGDAHFADLNGPKAEPLIRKLGLDTTLYSMAIANPGAVTLHNFPEALRTFERDGEIIDLAVVDIVRTRTRRVPRYNDFRAGLHLGRIRTFEQLTTEPRTLERLKSLYPSVDDIDTVVGLLAENPPEGFGFSDTAFRIFLLMASRRLQSDRFLTVDYRPEVYTPLGMDWVARNGMASVLLRHCPALAPVAGSGPGAFAPWREVTGAGR